MGAQLVSEGPTPGGRVLLTHPKGPTVEVTLFGAHIVSWKTPAAGAGAPPVERLWMSTISALDGSAPIRGGVPIAWPQFADLGPMPLHGFARERQWQLVSSASVGADGDEMVRAEFELTSDEQTAKGTWRTPAVTPFPFDFALRCVPVSRDSRGWSRPRRCSRLVVRGALGSSRAPRALPRLLPAPPRYTIELRATSLRLQLTVKHVAPPAEEGSSRGPMPFTGCLHAYFRTPDYKQVRACSGVSSQK
jgi:D-hexose-6-phosphate mutarotase